MRNYLTFVECSEKQKVAFISTFLREAAHEWLLLHEKENGTPKNWKELTQALIKRFGSNIRAQEAQMALMKISQGKRKMRDYSNEFQSLLCRLPSYDEKWMINLFIWGLQPHIAKSVGLQYPNTVTEAIKYAETADAALRASQKPHVTGNSTAGKLMSQEKKKRSGINKDKMREDEICKVFNKGKKSYDFSVQRVKGQWRKLVKNAGETKRRMNDYNAVKSPVKYIHTPSHAELEREDGLSRHHTVNGPAAVWRNAVNSISKKVRAGYLRRKGPIIEVNLAALARSKGAVVRTVSQWKQKENDEQQMQPSLKTREGRQSNRLLRREKEREARAHARERRFVTHVMQTVMSPSRGGIQSRTVVTPNQLLSWRFVEANRATIGNEENGQEKIGAENPNEQSQWYTVTDDIKEEAPSGQEKDQEKEDKEKKKVIRTVEDGLLMVVSARIYGRKIRTLIDSGATRCFVSPACVTTCGLKRVPRDVFLELGNGEKILSRGYIPDVPVVTAGLTVKTGVTVTNLLHDVDLVLGINWLKLVNPIVDWCGAKLYVPNAVHTALLQGNWLEDHVKVGTVTVLSSEEELDKLKDERFRFSISVLKAPKFWKWQDAKINSRANLQKGGEWAFVHADDCKLSNDCRHFM